MHGYEPFTFYIGYKQLLIVCHLLILIILSLPQFYNFHVLKYNSLLLYDIYLGDSLRKVLPTLKAKI